MLSRWRREILQRLPALAARDFVIFWIGQFVSLIGTWIQNTTQPYLAYRLTGRPFDLGLLGFAGTLPTLFLALPAGVLVERWDKRKTVMAMQSIMMGQAFLLAFLALSGRIQIWHLVVLALVLGAASAVEVTARQSMLVELVGKAALPNAIALQSTIFNLGRVLGPSLAGLILILVHQHGEGWAFFANGVSFLFVLVGLLFVRQPYRTPGAPNRSGSMLVDFREGWEYVRRSRSVSLIVMLAALVGFFGFPFGQQIPAIARTVLAQAGDTETLVKARTSALYLVQGIGALTASLFLAFTSNLRRKGLLLAVAESVYAVALLSLTMVHTIPSALILIAVFGWAIITQMTMMNTIVQLEVPDSLRGRVFSFYFWALQGVAPFGSLFVGWLAQWQGVPRAAFFCGALCLLAVLVAHLRNPILWKQVF